MEIELTAFKKKNYLHLYKFLLVLNDEQIFKLRSIVIGIKDLSAFSGKEIEDLERKLQERNRKLPVHS